MADGRMLRKKASDDERLAQLAAVSTHSLLLYLMSIPHLDVDGRLTGNPISVRGLVVPAIAFQAPHEWTDDLVDQYMTAWTLTRPAPLVFRYTVDDVPACFFPGFVKNQRIRRDREAPSRLPAPPRELLEQSTPATADLAPSANSGLAPGVKQKVQVEDPSAGLSVAPTRARAQRSEGLQVAQSIETSLLKSGVPDSIGDLASTAVSGSGLLLRDDLAALAARLRGADAGTAHLLEVWRRRGCGEREFAVAWESLERRRVSERRPLESEARYFCSELARLLGERREVAA